MLELVGRPAREPQAGLGPVGPEHIAWHSRQVFPEPRPRRLTSTFCRSKAASSATHADIFERFHWFGLQAGLVAQRRRRRTG